MISTGPCELKRYLACVSIRVELFLGVTIVSLRVNLVDFNDWERMFCVILCVVSMFMICKNVISVRRELADFSAVDMSGFDRFLTRRKNSVPKIV